jgi:hypothetical protein
MQADRAQRSAAQHSTGVSGYARPEAWDLGRRHEEPREQEQDGQDWHRKLIGLLEIL